MAFADDVVKPGRGRAIRIDVSLDDFSTVPYRYSDIAGFLDGGGAAMYEPRVLSMGTLSRGLGQNRVMTSGSTSLVLANADGAVDWLCGRENISNIVKARFRIYVVIYDATTADAGALVISSKLLGEYSIAKQYPVQTDTAVEVQLADDTLGALAQQAALPTLEDWAAVGTAANSPLKNGMGLPRTISGRTVVQLAFGEDWIQALPPIIPWGNDNYKGSVIIPICSTTNLDDADPDEVSRLRMEAWLSDDRASWLDLPRQFTSGWDAAPTVTDNWVIERSPIITKGTRQFRIIYIVTKGDYFGPAYLRPLYGDIVSLTGEDSVPSAQVDATLSSHQYDGGYPLSAINWAGFGFRNNLSRIIQSWVKMPTASSITNPTDPSKHACDIASDLAIYYASRTNSVNTTARSRVKAGNRHAIAAGVVQPWTTGPKKADPIETPLPPSLRQTFSLLAQSADIDLFVDWDGNLSFSSDVYDALTTTQIASLPTMREEEISINGIRRGPPSEGERHAAFSRLYLSGGKTMPPEQGLLPFQGPWDFYDQNGISFDDRAVESTWYQGWRTYRQQTQTPLYWRMLDITARDVVTVRTNLSWLRLDLGDYFRLTWTRGLGGPYVDSVFQVESISWSPASDEVEISAVWRDELTTVRSYILDDEDLLVATDVSFSDSIVTSGSTALATWADLINIEGYQGMVLVLMDSSLDEDDFSRFGAWRIISIEQDGGDPTKMLLTLAENAEGAYPASGTVAGGQWKIVFGATNNEPAVVTPALYPSGYEIYGKVTDTNGEYSNNEAGNRLISG